MIDIVKVFLQISISDESVVINNITLSEDIFQQVQASIGLDLILDLDVILRTLRCLCDISWKSSIPAKSSASDYSPDKAQVSTEEKIVKEGT